MRFTENNRSIMCGSFALLSAVSLLLAAPGAEGAAAETPVEAVPLYRCFCAQLTGGMPPYYVARIKQAPPECAGISYDINGKRPWENGLESCDDLEKCAKDLKKYAEKREILNAKTAEAKKRLEACCALAKEELREGTPCANKCGGDWSGILKVLAAETEKLDKAEAGAREHCTATPGEIKGKKQDLKPGGKQDRLPGAGAADGGSR